MSETKTETALAVIEKLTPMQLFAPGVLDPLLDRIKEEARTEAAKLDISTEKGRKAIASLAHKVARSKTFVDAQGKKSVEEAKQQIKAVDAERRRVWDELEALQAEVRKPLTEWEEADKARIAGHESALKEIEEAGPYSIQNWQTLPLEALRDRLTEIEKDSRNWEEFSVRAAGVKALAVNQIKRAIEQREKYDSEQVELARLRKEQAEREQWERDERIAREAREKAEREAREREEAAARAAKAEQVRIQREKDEAEQRAKDAEAKRIAVHQFAIGKLRSYAEWIDVNGSTAETGSIEGRLLGVTSHFDRDWEEFSLEAGELFAQIKTAYETAITAAKEREREQARLQEERRKQEAAEREAEQKKATEERIERERQSAAEVERQRQAEKERKEKEEAEARERNKKHCAAINRKAADALLTAGITEEQAKAVVTLIAKGAVPNVAISY